MINELLGQLGLTDKETTVYLALLQHGKATPPVLSLLTKINRTTIYSVSKELVEKGLISEDISTSPNTLIAKPPQELKLLIELQQKEIIKKQNIIEQLIPELHSLAKQTEYSIPKIKFIPEVDLETYLYDQTETWDKSLETTDHIWWGFQDPLFAPNYKKWIEWYWDRPSANKNFVRIVTNIKEQNLITPFPNRQLKFLGNDVKFNGTVWVMGHYLVMIQATTKPHHLLEIYDAGLAHNMREYFKAMWEKID